MTTPFLSVENLSIEIETSRGLLKVLRNVSFEIEAGSSVGIVGESGSGKSMTLKAVLDLLPSNAKYTSGEVYVEGKPLLAKSVKERRAILSEKIGIIFQDSMTALNPVLTVGYQIMEAPRFRMGWSKEKAQARAIELMGLVGIADAEKRLNAYPHQLSGGLRQRIAIAIALAGNPQMIFCDEPTTALDVTIQAQVLRLLLDLRAKENLGIVFVTHDLAVVNEICEDLLVMYAGRFIESGKVKETFRSPRHPYTYSLLKSAPDPEHTVDRLFSILGEPPDLTKRLVGCPFAPRCFAKKDDCLVSEPGIINSRVADAACFHSNDFKGELSGIEGVR